MNIVGLQGSPSLISRSGSLLQLARSRLQPLARPRTRGAEFAQIEDRVLQRVLGQPDAPIAAQALRWAI